MKSIDESEQWKHGGQCSKCRRQKYCGDVCKAAKAKTSSILSVHQRLSDLVAWQDLCHHYSNKV